MALHTIYSIHLRLHITNVYIAKATELILCNHELLVLEMSLIQFFSCHTLFILFMNLRILFPFVLKVTENEGQHLQLSSEPIAAKGPDIFPLIAPTLH